MNEFLIDFGNRMRKARLAKSIPQRELAESIGVAVGSIPGYENGQTAPSILTAKNIADALGVSYDWLTTGNRTVDLGTDPERAKKILDYIKFLDSQDQDNS
jgi:transcriptional regulator with XRE-family HTH domain